MATASEYVDQLKQLYSDLSLRQKLIAAGVTVAVLAGFALLFILINRPSYRTLYTELDQKDAADIVQFLKQEKIPYRLKNGGTTIQVPDDKVYDVRLALASQGIPHGTSVGFEIFDKSNLGTTDFVQKVNYQRALQGELEKTISRFPEVKGVRVHIAKPKESLFAVDKEKPTASVVLEMKPGRELSKTQIKGIVHLVACAVPRLSKENVSVVDTAGNVLYEYREPVGDSSAEQTRLRLAYQKRLEAYYRHKIQSMLEDALGTNKAVVRVAAEIDFDKVLTKEDRFDPDAVAVRSEQKNLELVRPDQAGGIPGVKGGLSGKLMGNTAGAGSEDYLTKKEESTKNYEITRLQRQIEGSIGTIKRLSVGVLVDGRYEEKDGKEVYVPRSEEEIDNLTQIVKVAMGYSDERGDDVSVVNLPFSQKAPEKGVVERAGEIFSKFIKPVANLILALIFIFAILKPLLDRFVLRPPEEAGMITGEEELALEGAGAAPGELPPAFEPAPDAKGELRELASNYPERAAALIKIWLREKMEEEEGK